MRFPLIQLLAIGIAMVNITSAIYDATIDDATAAINENGDVEERKKEEADLDEEAISFQNEHQDDSFQAADRKFEEEENLPTGGKDESIQFDEDGIPYVPGDVKQTRQEAGKKTRAERLAERDEYRKEKAREGNARKKITGSDDIEEVDILGGAASEKAMQEAVAGEHRSWDQLRKTAPEKFRLKKNTDGSWGTTCGLRGVNLGNWFLPEKWMEVRGFLENHVNHARVLELARGSLFEGSHADDFCSLSTNVGRDELNTRMQRHIETWMNQTDFAYLAKSGVNVVRIPLGYWNIVKDFTDTYAPIDPEHSLEVLDKAFEWAEKYGMAVILDVHGSPGSQNAEAHSGCSKRGIGLFPQKDDSVTSMTLEMQQASVTAIEDLAQRYSGNPGLLGIQVINEPRGYQRRGLMNLYKAYYEAVRKHHPDAWVIVSAEDQSIADDLSTMFKADKKRKLKNLVLDKHKYACFEMEPPEDAEGHQELATKWSQELKEINKQFPTIIGEWSTCHGGGWNDPRAWADQQQKVFSVNTVGSIFWSYKIRGHSMHWSLQDLLSHQIDVGHFETECEGEHAHRVEVKSEN